MIPIETAGRKLDDDSWDRRGPVVTYISADQGGDVYAGGAVEASDNGGGREVALS